ncbi:ribosome recycling factor [Anaerofustis sp.]|uniref:ribosome recycling factor n=1 Tax=Anaerofustis sp. TaxID=1872517 RepID=UPI0025C38F44|nr:ribosome recycling factor [Anaerofustis sp.]
MTKEIQNQTKEKMIKAVENLQSNLNALRAGRANPAMLDRIVVDYYGTPTPVNQMASISAPEPRMLTVQPWDQSALSLIEKAIMNSDLGLNPSNDGKVIRLSIPQLTEERRKELCKIAEKEGENSKVAVRNIRRNAIHDLKAAQKNGELTEDSLKDFEDEIQKLTNEYVKEIDNKVKAKEKEITTI